MLWDRMTHSIPTHFNRLNIPILFLFLLMVFHSYHILANLPEDVILREAMFIFTLHAEAIYIIRTQ